MVEDFINYARTKYVDLDSLRTDCTLKTPFSLSDLRIDISSLWSSLHSGNFSAFPIADIIFADRKLIYACVNPSHRKLYIGQTNNMATRLRSHLKLAFNHKTKYVRTDRFHSFMA